MENKKISTRQKLGASIAITVGFGLALGNATGNNFVGFIIAFPIGVALYLQ